MLRLVSGIGRLTNPQHMPMLKQQRISLSQFLVLDVLVDKGAAVRMTELAAAAGLTASELTRVVSELETKKWVMRDTDPNDSRARLVNKTAAGTRLIRQVHTQAARELRGVWSDFTHDEWHRFIDYLQRFENGLNRVRGLHK
jgi:DNA-binding MarR family transcriptional regulator